MQSSSQQPQCHPLPSDIVDKFLSCHLSYRFPGIMVEGTVDRKTVRHSGAALHSDCTCPNCFLLKGYE